ncbi:histidine kinase [Paraflavitalea pollutisoli]|uniref:tetratricopeptide repeat-containing sensor histidine kinase n=1 Tax=Paraflavitalea pollutisoli TaxID=3034143 RepID=UPI0023ECACF4|nr:histidine kinase [Paraflavitalea sp. H1-2-19X]
MHLKDTFTVNYCYWLVLCMCYTNDAFAQPIWTDSTKDAVHAQKEDTNKVFALLTLSEYYKLSYPDSALIYARQALNLANKLRFESGKFWANTACSNILMILGDYPQELTHVFESFSQAKKLNTPRPLAVANAMMSGYYYALGEYGSSLRYWNEVRRITERWFADEMWGIWLNLSNIYAGLHKPDSAMLFARNAYAEIVSNQRLYRKDYESQKETSATFILLGNRFADNRQFDSALYYFRRSFPDSINHQLSINTMLGYNGLAKVFYATGRVDSAIFFSGKVLESRIARSYPISLWETSILLASIYEQQKKPDSTLKYERLGYAWKDSLFNRERMLNIRDITYREQEKRQQDETTKVNVYNRYRIYLLIGLSIVALLAAAMLLKIRKDRQHQNMRNSIADDLHDDIGSTLSSIRIMTELSKSKPSEMRAVLDSIEEHACLMQDKLTDIVWSVNPKNDRFENIILRMNTFASELAEAKSIDLNFCSNVRTSTRLSMVQRKSLFLFFKEAVNNWAKHSSASSVCIKVSQKGSYIELAIRDNGIGFDRTNTTQGNGMDTLKSRAQDLRADFSIVSQVSKGTAVYLRFKIN